MKSLSYFMIFYSTLIITFAIFGFITFRELWQFRDFKISLITLFDASLGSYDFAIFDPLKEEGSRLFG